MNEKIRILIVDDHPVVRDGLIAILSTQPDFAVVGEAGDGRAALAQIPTRQPDIILLDLEMPEMDGVETLRQLKTARMDLPVIVFTAYDQ
jgi:DNA-binding NarL/FixJ family response regulator